MRTTGTSAYDKEQMTTVGMLEDGFWPGLPIISGVLRRIVTNRGMTLLHSVPMSHEEYLSTQRTRCLSSRLREHSLNLL